MEHAELGGETKKEALEETMGRETREPGGVNVGAEGIQRIAGVGRCGDLPSVGPVRAGRLGMEYDVMAHPILTRTRLGAAIGEPPLYERTFPIKDEALVREREALAGKTRTEVDSLMQALIEERSLALSEGPAVFTGNQPAAWIARTDLFLDRNHVPEGGKLRIALSYLDENITRWYTLSLNEDERPYDWKGLKVMLQE